EAMATYGGAYKFEHKANQYLWERTLLEDTFRDVEERRRSIQLADLPDANGEPRSAQAKLSGLFDMLESDLARVRFRAAEDAKFALDYLTGVSKREYDRAQALNAYIDSVPELRAMRLLGQDAKAMSTSDFFRALSLSLSQIRQKNVYEFADYIDTPL